MIKLHEIKTLSALVLPLMAAFLAQKGMQFIDTLMMGWIGPEALAAGALGTSIFLVTLVFCMGILSLVGVGIVRAKGANNNHEIQSGLLHGQILALLLSIPAMLIIWHSPRILTLIGEDPKVIHNVVLLLHGIVWGFPGYLMFLVMREFISAFSLTRVVMFVSLGSIPITFTANYILIYGLFGLPQLGVAGIGYASGLIMWLMFASLLIYSKNHKDLKQYFSFESFKLEPQNLLTMLYLGIPSGIILVLETGLFLFAAIVMGYFGVAALAAHQIAMQCASIAYTIPFALSMSTSIQVGYAIGAKDPHQAQRNAYIGLAVGVFLTFLIALIFVFTAPYLASIFLKGDETEYETIKQLATTFLILAALFQCFDGVQSIAVGALRGLKDTLVPMILCVGCYWFIGIGGGYYFAFYTSAGPAGIWYGITIGLISIGIILTLRLINRLRYEIQSET